VRARFLDYARWRLSWRSWACCLPLHRQRRHPESVFYRGSMAARSPAEACLRTARGRCGSLLHRSGLAPLTPCGAGACRTPFDRRASRKSRRIEKDWPSVQHVCRVTRFRQARKMANGKIASLPAGETAPEALLCANRGHWGIEIMHRNKDAILGEDCYTNRCGNAPRNIFSLIGIALNILKSASPSPTRPFACSQVDPPRLLLDRPDMLILSMTMDRTHVIDGHGN
jgi:predicted transposase YbfD/YdcC